MPASENSRRSLVSANWKMNLNHFEAIQVVQKLAFALKPEIFESVEVSLHPPFTDLRTVQTVLESDKLPMSLGAQHCHWDDAGAFTGEVSPAMLSKLNVQYVLAGHSERRQLFGETDELVGKRTQAIRRNQMTPIVCVGETLDLRESGQAESTVQSQLSGALEGLPPAAVGELVVAYEPVWAIGTGHTATAEDAQQMCGFIRSLVDDKWGTEAASSVRLQYGGSVRAVNAEELMSQRDVDGLLVGGASLDPDEFSRIVTAASTS